MLPSGAARQSAPSPGQKRDTLALQSEELCVCGIMLPKETGLTQQETYPSPRRLRPWQRCWDAGAGALLPSCRGLVIPLLSLPCSLLAGGGWPRCLASHSRAETLEQGGWGADPPEWPVSQGAACRGTVLTGRAWGSRGAHSHLHRIKTGTRLWCKASQRTLGKEWVRGSSVHQLVSPFARLGTCPSFVHAASKTWVAVTSIEGGSPCSRWRCSRSGVLTHATRCFKHFT